MISDGVDLDCIAGPLDAGALVGVFCGRWLSSMLIFVILVSESGDPGRGVYCCCREKFLWRKGEVDVDVEMEEETERREALHSNCPT